MREPRSKPVFDRLIGKAKINKCRCIGSPESHFQKLRLVMVQDLFVRPGRIDLELKRASARSADGLRVSKRGEGMRGGSACRLWQAGSLALVVCG
jgi:hypothetical protein